MDQGARAGHDTATYRLGDVARTAPVVLIGIAFLVAARLFGGEKPLGGLAFVLNALQASMAACLLWSQDRPSSRALVRARRAVFGIVPVVYRLADLGAGNQTTASRTSGRGES